MIKKGLIAILLTCLLPGARAQTVAVGIHTGFASYINNTSIGIPVGVNAEWAFNTDHSFAAKAHYNIGIRAGDADFFYISPEYKYHVVGESLDGFYVGGYLGFGGGGGTGYVSIGALTGYSLPVGERFNLEANVEIGYGNFTNLNVHVLHLVPSFGARYSF
jgi:hypothetical protein